MRFGSWLGFCQFVFLALISQIDQEIVDPGSFGCNSKHRFFRGGIGEVRLGPRFLGTFCDEKMFPNGNRSAESRRVPSGVFRDRINSVGICGTFFKVPIFVLMEWPFRAKSGGMRNPNQKIKSMKIQQQLLQVVRSVSQWLKVQLVQTSLWLRPICSRTHLHRSYAGPFPIWRWPTRFGTSEDRQDVSEDSG